MNIALPQTYLIGLSSLLLIIAILVGRQLFKVRQDEIKLIRLEKGGINSSSQDSADLYELASVQLRKRLYPQAISSLRQALKQLHDDEPNEAKALIENALGFALAAENDFKGAIVHYKKALKAKSDYPVALNNLAFANERLMQDEEAYAIYYEVIKLQPNNKTALTQIEKIERRTGLKPESIKGKKGF